MRRKLNFEIVRLLDSGGRGDVYLGYIRETNLWVAVKYLREFHIPQQRQGFSREINTLLRGGPGMVKILGFNMSADPPYYVMEYLAGGNLTQYAGRLPQHRLVSLGVGLANALTEFHERCGAHGDYKPDNILLTRDGQLRLGDPAGNGFGFSVLFAPARGGTPGYWAPEIRGNGSVSVQSDVFSFGATLFHVVTGYRPVDGQSLDPWSYGLECPTALRDVILLCTQIDPRMRPPLRQVIRGLGGESWESIRASYRHQQERGRNIGLAVAACLVLVFLISK